MKPTCELLIRVGDSAAQRVSDRWYDGMVVTVASPGVYFPPAEVSAWLRGEEPARLRQLGVKRRREMRVWVERTRELIATPVEEIAKRLWPRSPLTHIDDARARKNQAIKAAAAAKDRGWDSCWGYMDLCTHFAISASLTLDEVADITFEPENVGADALTRAEAIGRRLFRLPWRTILPAAAVDEVLDPQQHVPAFRRLVVDFDAFELVVPA